VARTSVCSVGFSRRLRFLADPTGHRLKPMMQAEARATSRAQYRELIYEMYF
jgi:hypothetical protein